VVGEGVDVRIAPDLSLVEDEDETEDDGQMTHGESVGGWGERVQGEIRRGRGYWQLALSEAEGLAVSNWLEGENG